MPKKILTDFRVRVFVYFGTLTAASPAARRVVALQGAIVTTVGFQKGALNAAKAYGIALIIATVNPEWFQQPDKKYLLVTEWKFMNHGYVSTPFFGPWPMGCAHHGRMPISALLVATG